MVDGQIPELSSPPKARGKAGRPRGTPGRHKTDIEKLKSVTHSLVGKLAKVSVQKKPKLTEASQKWLFGSKDSALTTVMTLTEVLLLLDKATRNLDGESAAVTTPPPIAESDVALIETFLNTMRGEEKNEPLV